MTIGLLLLIACVGIGRQSSAQLSGDPASGSALTVTGAAVGAVSRAAGAAGRR